jgi:hypothetical protein
MDCVTETVQFFKTDAVTPKLAVAVFARAGVDIGPSAKNPRTAEAKANVTVLEHFIGETPGSMNFGIGGILCKLMILRNSTHAPLVQYFRANL